MVKKSRVFLGDGKGKIPPLFNDGILISWGPINPYEIGLIFPSPMEMSWELSLDPIAQVMTWPPYQHPSGGVQMAGNDGRQMAGT